MTAFWIVGISLLWYLLAFKKTVSAGQMHLISNTWSSISLQMGWIFTAVSLVSGLWMHRFFGQEGEDVWSRVTDWVDHRTQGSLKRDRSCLQHNLLTAPRGHLVSLPVPASPLLCLGLAEVTLALSWQRAVKGDSLSIYPSTSLQKYHVHRVTE